MCVETTDARVRTAARPGEDQLGGSIAVVLRRYLPSDWSVSVYLTVTAAFMVLWGDGLAYRWEVVAAHAVMLLVVFAVVRYSSDAESRGVRFIRLLYLPLVITVFYVETSLLMHVFHPGWFDQQIITLERSFLGISPSLWIQPWQGLLLSEWMMLGYFSYYFIIAVPLLVLFFKRRDHDIAQLVWALSLAFFISYLGFIIYPVQGPRFEFAGLYERNLTGYLFVPLVGAVMESAAVHGGCMPSSHVAASVVSMVYIYKHDRRIGLVCVLLVATLCLATVYGRFHYLSDVAVGLLVAGFAIRVADRWPVKEWMVRPGGKKTPRLIT